HPAADLFVRVQLQQLQRHLPDERGRAVPARQPAGGRHRPAHHLYLPAGVRRLRRPVRLRGRDLGLHLPDRGPGLRGRVPAYPATGGGVPVTAIPPERARPSGVAGTASTGVAPAGPRGAAPPPGTRDPLPRGRAPRRRWWAEVGWRHGVALVAVAFALFPVAFVVSAALNPLGTLSSSHLVPRGASAGNFVALLRDTSFPWWFVNSVLISGAAAVSAVFISALAAYAFSRMRFRGRRAGLLSLLLIQMFPQFLAIVTIFLMFTTITEYWPAIGFNSVAGLMLLYLGGALGVNTWLTKGFLDTVPRELDES